MSEPVPVRPDGGLPRWSPEASRALGIYNTKLGFLVEVEIHRRTFTGSSNGCPTDVAISTVNGFAKPQNFWRRDELRDLARRYNRQRAEIARLADERKRGTYPDGHRFRRT